MSTRAQAAIESRRVVLDVAQPGGRSTTVGVRYLAAGERGATPPVVLLHGIGLDAAAISWKRALPSLAADRRVLALDLPGHGRSDKPARSYTTAYYGAVLEAFLDSLGVERVVLVGISMGGALALGRALAVPEQVSRLVLVDSHGLGRDAPWRAPGFLTLWTPFFDSVLEASLRDPATIAAGLRAMTVDPDPDFLADVGRAVKDPATVRALTSWQRSEFGVCGLRTCYLDRLTEVSIPTLLIHGRDDPVFPVSWSARASERIEGSSLHVIENCGHWPPRERPRRFNRLVGDFLADERMVGA
jgi:pimeloyl-ACP methyl ester carboxylesterase